MAKGKTFIGFYLAVLLLTGTLVYLWLPGCGGSNGGGSVPTGTLQVGITDSPAFRDFSSVHIRIDKVVVVPAGMENAQDNDLGLLVIASFPGGLDVDILKFHFIQQLLGTAVIPAGTYSQVRLILAPNPQNPPFNNYFILTSSPAQQIALTTPSAQETGVKIVGRFTVTAGVLNTILLDFNPNEAIVMRGNSGKNNLKPTGIRIMQTFTSLTNAGSISGTIRSPAFSTWSSATFSVVPRNPAASAIVAGAVFSNFSSPSVWKAPFTTFVPPNGSSLMPAANYRVFVDAGSKFRLYSSPPLVVSAGTDTLVTPNAIVNLTPAP